jgi:hypothetical protein
LRIWIKRWNWQMEGLATLCSSCGNAPMWRSWRGSGSRRWNFTKRCICYTRRPTKPRGSSLKAWPISTSKSEKWYSTKNMWVWPWRSTVRIRMSERWVSCQTVGPVLAVNDINTTYLPNTPYLQW